jgi:hypothetical protein
MSLEFLKRIWKTTLVVGVIVFAFTAVYADMRFAWGLLVGCLWGVANFIALTAVLTSYVTPGKVNRKRALILAGVKFPVIYGIGYLILASEWFEPVSLLVGFSLLFMVTLLKALGRSYLKLDDRATALTRSNPVGSERPLPKGEVKNASHTLPLAPHS